MRDKQTELKMFCYVMRLLLFLFVALSLILANQIRAVTGLTRDSPVEVLFLRSY